MIILLKFFWVRSSRLLCPVDVERGGCVAQVCGSCNVPNHGIAERRLIAILSLTLNVISAPNAPAPSAIRRVYN